MEEGLDAQVAAILKTIPEVCVVKKKNHAAFSVAGKVFAYTRNDSLVIKLPAEEVMRLTHKPEFAALVMGKRVMKDWVVVTRPRAADYKKDLPLLRKSVTFTAG